MLNKEEIKKSLLAQKEKVEQEIKELEQEDPVLEGAGPESSEPGTDSWLADAHTTNVAVEKNLTDLLKKINHSLELLKNGKYGKCEKCGKDIEESRLEAMPTATLCISCSKQE